MGCQEWTTTPLQPLQPLQPATQHRVRATEGECNPATPPLPVVTPIFFVGNPETHTVAGLQGCTVARGAGIDPPDNIVWLTVEDREDEEAV